MLELARDPRLATGLIGALWRAAGRQTRSGAELVEQLAESGTAKPLAVVAPMATNVRDVMVKGKSGTLTVSWPDFMAVDQPSIWPLTWPNEIIATCFSAKEPKRVRDLSTITSGSTSSEHGVNHHQVYDMPIFGLHLGTDSWVCAAGTPLAMKLIKALVADSKTVISKSTTYENRTHLARYSSRRLLRSIRGALRAEYEMNDEPLEIT